MIRAAFTAFTSPTDKNGGVGTWMHVVTFFFAAHLPFYFGILRALVLVSTCMHIPWRITCGGVITFAVTCTGASVSSVVVVIIVVEFLFLQQI